MLYLTLIAFSVESKFLPFPETGNIMKNNFENYY